MPATAWTTTSTRMAGEKRGSLRAVIATSAADSASNGSGVRAKRRFERRAAITLSTSLFAVTVTGSATAPTAPTPACVVGEEAGADAGQGVRNELAACTSAVTPSGPAGNA